MAIRLSKAIKEFSIGLQTAVEFLEKRAHLGELKSDPNFKLNDAQYEALAEGFKSDKEARSQVDLFQQKRPKEKKREPESFRAETLLESNRTQYKPVGKIDLESLKRPAAKPAPATPIKEEKVEKPKEPVETIEKEVPTKTETLESQATQKVEAPQEVKPAVEAPKAPEKPEPQIVEEQPKVQEAPKAEKVEEEKPVEIEVQNKVETPKPVVEPQPEEIPVVSAPEEPKPEEKKLFTLKSEQKNAPKVNVLGKIDLSSINQSTRPKKKTKEEKRKEREEKAQQQHSGSQNGEKKKRVRINKERVDINAASQNNGSAPNNNNSNNNNNQGGGGKNKSKKERNRKRNQRPLEVNEEDVARQVKETLARLTTKNQNKKGAKYRKEKREAVQEKLQEERREQNAESKTLKLTEFVTVSELATMMNVAVTQVIGTCMSIGIMVSINQRLDAETINIVADEFGFKTEYVSAEVQNAITEEEDDENDLVPRAPIVTVMGHVDHGKTSLLDHIRNTNVIAGEAGGITQHIGAYNVELKDGRQITFLDTPGHEAFTAMRARGAQVTDIAIIIIAADDSVMPTTKEAIAHAQAANVPMVFAINKIDKPGANPDKIREDLANMNLLVEDWGGKYQCQEISAKKGMGVDELLVRCSWRLRCSN